MTTIAAKLHCSVTHNADVSFEICAVHVKELCSKTGILVTADMLLAQRPLTSPMTLPDRLELSGIRADTSVLYANAKQL
jgi:hypothetical protein